MALPTSALLATFGRYSAAGITLQIYPSTVRGLSVEVQQATANSTASSVWRSVILPPTSASALRYTAKVPDSTRLFYFRARHPAQPGYSAGAFTPTISARAKLVPDIQRPILPQITYQGNVEVPVGTGLQVFDTDGATVVDITGTTRILAVPVQASVDSGTSLSVDLATGLTHQIRLTGTATITFTNPTNGGRYRVWFQQDTTGSRPFPTIKGSGGDEIVMFTNDTAPTLTTTPGALDLFEFEYRTTPTSRFTCMTLQTNVLLPTPQVQSITQTSVGGASTTHNISMPAAVDAGDLLLMLFARSGTSAVTTPTDWSLIASQGRLYIFAKDAVGTEDGTTVNVATAVAETAAAQVYRITRWGGTVPTYVSGSVGTETTDEFPDPPNHTPIWSVDRDLWIAAFGSDGGTVTAYPTDYTNGTDTVSGGGDCTLSSARRARYATSENPGTFELLASQTWNAVTVAVRPVL